MTIFKDVNQMRLASSSSSDSQEEVPLQGDDDDENKEKDEGDIKKKSLPPQSPSPFKKKIQSLVYPLFTCIIVDVMCR